MTGTGTWALVNVGLAGLLGAMGVALAAVAAHRVAEPSLATAALFLILHGAAAMALSALAGTAPWSTGFLVSASLMVFAAALFSGDVAARVLVDTRLFPMAAPAGGSLLILAWLTASVSAVVALVKS